MRQAAERVRATLAPLNPGLHREAGHRSGEAIGPAAAAPPHRQRLLAALGVALATVPASLYYQQVGAANDLAQLLFAGRAAWAGQNPYALIGPGRAFEWGWPLYYPGPAIALALPLAHASAFFARIVFVAVSAGCLAYAVTARGWHWLGVFLSTPFIVSAEKVQWTPLLTAAYLLPALSPVWAAKPNFAAAFLFARLERRTLLWFVTGAAVLAGVAWWLVPGWFGFWWRETREAQEFYSPLLCPYGGPLLALALVQWKKAEARLVLGLACIPQTWLLYNTLPLLLIARTRRDIALLVGLTWLAFMAQFGVALLGGGHDVVGRRFVGVSVVCLYLPALALAWRQASDATG